MEKSIMDITNIKELLHRGNEIEIDFIDDTYKYWINGHDYVRSPFPDFIVDELISISKDKFFDWASGVDIKIRKEYDKEKLTRKLEEFIFSTAYDLVKNEDDKITICYPFLPRIGDKLKEPGVEETGENDTIADSKIYKRKITKENNCRNLKIYLKNMTTGNQWETCFLLPE